MTRQTPSKLSSAWTHWYRRALPAYWIFLFCVTHFPGLKLELPVSFADKIAHAACFGLLAFLFWRFAESYRGPLSNRFGWLALAWISLYAALDEWLQLYVNRGGDVWDGLADVAGTAVVLGLLEWRRRRATVASDALDSLAAKR